MTDTDTQKLIDRLYQRGMAEDDSCNPDAGDLMRQAAARLTALDRPAGGGWKLVPVEPTEAMLEAGLAQWSNLRDIWSAMLAAAPNA